MATLANKTGKINSSAHKGILFYMTRGGSLLGGEKIIESFPNIEDVIKAQYDASSAQVPLGAAVFFPLTEEFLGCGVIIATGSSVDFDDFVASFDSVQKGSEQVAMQFPQYDIAGKVAVTRESLDALELEVESRDEVLEAASKHFNMDIEIWD